MPTLDDEPGRGGAVTAPPVRPAGSLLVLRILLILAAIVFAALGAWQVQRLFWKLDLIARVEERVAAAPVTAPPQDEWPSVNAADLEYLHVRATGILDHARETVVQAVTERGPGFWVMTPLQLQAGGSILINRGFVPPDKRDPTARLPDVTAKPVTVSGLLRVSEPGGGFLRSNDPSAGRWYSRDVAAIASAKGLSDAAPFFIDADATANPGDYPVGGLTVIHFRNSHLVYAATWFTLALMAFGAAVLVTRFVARD
jgi:surfeit locus 1 family protein